MGNRFTNQKAGEISVKLGNSGTDLFFAVLILSASDVAENDWQKLFTCWLAGHDQSLRGSGFVGFDIDEIGWTKDGFDTEKTCVLKVIDMAIQKHRWEDFSFAPSELFVEKLQAFRELVATYEKSFIEKDNAWGASLIESNMAFALCPKHDVYMHLYGCYICNNESEL